MSQTAKRVSNKRINARRNEILTPYQLKSKKTKSLIKNADANHNNMEPIIIKICK